jgi:hypothetical protein
VEKFICLRSEINSDRKIVGEVSKKYRIVINSINYRRINVEQRGTRTMQNNNL